MPPLSYFFSNHKSSCLSIQLNFSAPIRGDFLCKTNYCSSYHLPSSTLSRNSRSLSLCTSLKLPISASRVFHQILIKFFCGRMLRFLCHHHPEEQRFVWLLGTHTHTNNQSRAVNRFAFAKANKVERLLETLEFDQFTRRCWRKSARYSTISSDFIIELLLIP